MSAELLAKLTAHGVNITGEGFGGTPEITQSDVAGAMAGMRKEVYEFVLLKYCADARMMERVIERVTWRVIGETFTGSYDPGMRLISRIAVIIVHMATEGPICETCNGTGTYASKSCHGCRGTGKTHMTQGKCAGMARISVPTYKKYWARLVDDHVLRLDGYASEGLGYVSRQLREETLQ
ncbi:MAG: hypothetical protein DRH08_12385 [Deltaproteobacteria bacterium]|nr:MAG: hypothetical protein DRH08_12385 [Deltaproteobacteria bacterium]